MKTLSSSLIAASCFLKKLFDAVTAEIQQLQNINETLPCQWYEHLVKNGNRERLYASVVTMTEVSCRLITEILSVQFL
jgi:hypothetical protein